MNQIFSANRKGEFENIKNSVGDIFAHGYAFILQSSFVK